MKQKRLNIKLGTRLVLLAFCTTTGLVRCKKDAATEIASNPTLLGTIHTKATNLSISTTPYDLTLSLPSGYKTDGTVDYTAYLQKAINTYSNITFPAFPIMVDDLGLVVGSNKLLTFLPGSKLILKASSNANYNIINILMANNVTLNNPVIVGDRYIHIGTIGCWGQGIAINGSTNVTINSPTITNCWGDGIYMGQKGGINNQNITIKNAYCRYNRRNGIGITNAIGLDLEAPYAGYCDGADPWNGIDIEPNSYNDEIQKITINNAITEHNVGNGISAGFKNLFGGPNKTISIQINNHADKASTVAFHCTATLTQQVGTETVTGPVNVANPFWRRNTNTPITTNLLVKTIQLNISKPAVQDINGVNLTNTQIVSLFTYKTHINSGANYTLTF
jgi:hypothetical protein